MNSRYQNHLPLANRNTEKHTLNPDPKDQVSDEKFREI
jgi:hypothetical protein